MKQYFTFFILVLAGLIGCKSNYDAPCRSQVVIDSTEFTFDEGATIPYHTHDTLYFVTGTHDTVKLFTQSFNYYHQLLTTKKDGNPECPPDYDGYRALEVVMNDSVLTQQFTYTAYKKTDTVSYTLASRSIQLPFTALLKIDSTFHDSIGFANKMFYNVYGFKNNANDSFYISHSFGLVHLLTNGTTYTLIKFNSK